MRLFKGLGNYRRRVQTAAPLAARYLNQGFASLYGFDYDIAEMSFREATRFDPKLVIGYWGIAASNGNFINRPEVSPEASKKALDALATARRMLAQGTPDENNLVEACERIRTR